MGIARIILESERGIISYQVKSLDVFYSNKFNEKTGDIKLQMKTKLKLHREVSFINRSWRTWLAIKLLKLIL